MKFLSKEKISNHRYKTPEGYLVCLDAIIARTGKQDYCKNEIFKDSDDSIISIDRPYKEVFAPETIASFENKPFVDEHPSEDVNVDNHRDYAIGFIRDVRQAVVDGEDVLIANLVVTNPEAIAEIESGKKNELSCGYDCDILGDKDNYYQANIRGNHVALCKASRAGIARILDSINDAATTRKMFKESDVEDKDSYLGTTERSTPKGNMYVYRKNGKIISEMTDDYGIYNLEKGEIRKFNSVHELNKWLNNFTNDSIKDSKWYIVYGEESGYMKEFKTLNEAKKFIKETQKFDRENDIEDTYYIEVETHDSIKDSTGEDWHDALHDNNVEYEFIKGGYGMKFKTSNDYRKAKELAKKIRYTKGHWYDKDLEFFEYGNIQISNDDLVEEKMIKDKNLGQSFLKVGQKVHLDPTKNKRLDKEDLDAEYEIIGFWYNGKLVTKDPVSKQEFLGLSGVRIKNTVSGQKLSVNRFQLMDSIEDEEIIKDSVKANYKKYLYKNSIEDDLIKDWKAKEFSYKDYDVYKVGTNRDFHYEVYKGTEFIESFDENEYSQIKTSIDNHIKNKRDSKTLDSVKARKLIKVYRIAKDSIKVKDSDKLKQLAYKFAQMGNYFDRANSANSRNLLAREDNVKIAEFYKLGLAVYEQLKKETDYLKNNRGPAQILLLVNSETSDLLKDGAERLYWTGDPKCRLLSKKLEGLIKEYKRYSHKDSINDEEIIKDADERLIKILEKIANDYNKVKTAQSNSRTSKSDLRYINTKHELSSNLRNDLKKEWDGIIKTFSNSYQLQLTGEPSLEKVDNFKKLLKGEKHKK